MGTEIRARRGGRDHLVVRLRASARASAQYATIVSDDRVPFWRARAGVHEHDCKYILQLSHGGRQRDITTIATR